jgi:hypothetical protein
LDFTNETASHPLARKKRGGSTLASCNLPFKQKIEMPTGRKESIIKKKVWSRVEQQENLLSKGAG